MLYRHALAEYCPRILRSLVYKKLYKQLREEYTLCADDFNGKNILVVGPANTVHNDLLFIDKSKIDIVVRMKNGIHTSIDLWNEDSLRCDVLFHSFRSGSQPVTIEDLNHAGVKLIIHRTLKKSSFLDTLLAEKKFGDVAQIKIIPYERYSYLTENLGGYAPSTGMVCADFFLNTPFSSLTFVGFTFFSTRYVPGYNDKISSDEDALSTVKDAGHHSPSHEAHLIRDLVCDAKRSGKDVYLSESMQQAMDKISAS
ncbi:hypothetical protein E4L95_14930 [Paracoccus liaowanqingii]|uniref:Uncharacterized protein n=1 Tax=Paracoccus liaowanqingii TaxID=2560053 RepID=A0A4Z1C980_9RHOB|nr:hypothetical protein [Paracoccus liaowanqingii]TGN55581.1 hypothetical protein E4L95_14930 [Paracoccus liaowanqingii]